MANLQCWKELLTQFIQVENLSDGYANVIVEQKK